MNNEIQQFDFKGASLRTLTDEAGEPWFVAKDVCDILGMSNPSMAVTALDKDEVAQIDPKDYLGSENRSNQAVNIVSEPGLYKLIMRSRKPEAKEFQRWVTHEVLPQIRRTGGYIPTTDADDDMTILAKAVMIGQRTMEAQKQRIAEQSEHIRELEPKAQALDDFTNVEDRLLVRDAAKVLSNAGTPIKEKQLREWMADHNWIFKSGGSWHPTAAHCAAGHLVMVMSQKHGVKNDGMEFAFPPTVRITRKGLALLHKRLGEITLDKALDAEAAE